MVSPAPSELVIIAEALRRQCSPIEIDAFAYDLSELGSGRFQPPARRQAIRDRVGFFSRNGTELRPLSRLQKAGGMV